MPHYVGKPPRETAGELKVERNPISVSQAVNFAGRTFKKRYGLFLAVLLTIFGAWIVLEIVVIAGQRFGILLWAVAHLAFLLFFASVEIGFLQICLGLYDGREPKFADTFAQWFLGLKFLAGQIFFLLVVVSGLLLWVVPGVYLGVRYALFGFCMAASEADLIESFRQSAILSASRGINLVARQSSAPRENPRFHLKRPEGNTRPDAGVPWLWTIPRGFCLSSGLRVYILRMEFGRAFPN